MHLQLEKLHFTTNIRVIEITTVWGDTATVALYTCTGRRDENIFCNVVGGTRFSRKVDRGYESPVKYL